MKIRELINVLEAYEKDSDLGKETNVDILLHVQEWNTSGFYVELPIEDVAIAYAGPDCVHIDVVIDNNNILNVNSLMNKLNKIKYLD